MNLKVVSSLLSHYGITIDTALSGSEGIQIKSVTEAMISCLWII